MNFKIAPWRLFTAAGVALVADVLQYVLIPLGTPLGIMDPDGVDQVLDCAVASVMVGLLGFHWVFVPSAIGKLVPFVDMMPFWSGAVFFVAMGEKRKSGDPAGDLENGIFPGVHLPGVPSSQSSLPSDIQTPPSDGSSFHWIKP